MQPCWGAGGGGVQSPESPMETAVSSEGELLEQQPEQLRCETSPHPTPATLPVAVWFGAAERRLQHSQFEYTSDPNVTSASPTKSFLRCWAKGTAA
ncbi:hypothetical protein Celaphus_00010583 [Cervus elaphus hippelaphus]|uniref:Uncharacterized protein n=1 Tax=Cervus elaphus hippelaphus TaxID=46360 RepID=A0A212CAB2_CEREH|nr:hypothetical protein Celaphus_00010583 [Cervus elaphus hippelaphus]